MHRLHQWLIFIFLFFFISPRLFSQENLGVDNKAASRTNIQKSHAQQKVTPEQRVKQVEQVVQKWNQNLDQHDLDQLKKLYSSEVNAYGTWMSLDQLIKIKTDFLKKYQQFKQTYRGKLEVIKLDHGLTRANFIKEVQIKDSKKEYWAYLVFDKKNRILVESDLATDHRLALNAEGKKLEDGRYCYGFYGWQLNQGAVPTKIDNQFNLIIKDKKVEGEGWRYLPASRMMTDLKISGWTNHKNELVLIVKAYTPVNDSKPLTNETERWKVVNGILNYVGKDASFFEKYYPMNCQSNKYLKFPYSK